MNTNKVLLYLAIAIIVVGVYFVLFTEEPDSTPNTNTISEETSTQTDTDTQVEEDTELAEGEELPADLAVYEGWEQVDGEGYYFMHPGYFIQDNGDHHIMAYEPRVGQEFSALVIFKPVTIADPVADLNKKITDSEGLGVNVVTEPTQTSIEGTKDAYYIEYEIESGLTTGLNKYYLLQSPSTDQWVAIEYADNETAENIRKSFHFID